jgi:hypothetical protein
LRTRRNRREEGRRGRKLSSRERREMDGEIREAKDASSAHRRERGGVGIWYIGKGKTRAGGLCLCSFDSTKGAVGSFGLLGRRIGLPGHVWCHDDSALSLVRIQKINNDRGEKKGKKEK